MAIELSPLLSDGAVFSRNREIYVFGFGEGALRAEFLGDTREATARNGRAELRFPPREAGGPYEMRVWLNGEARVLRDLYVGDVVLLAGQSNAEMKLADTGLAADPDADDAMARVYHARKIESEDAFDGRWSAMRVENAPNWSAIGYHLARALRREHGVAVGVVCCYQGAAVIQSFLSPETAGRFLYDANSMHPDHTYDCYSASNHPSRIHDAMLAPLYPYAVTEAVWYQGESNTSVVEGARYGEMLAALISEMRAGFRAPELPFAVVRINDYLAPVSEEGWRLVQAAQTRAAREIPGVALVTIDDMGQAERIHPTNKREVALRVAAALDALRQRARDTRQ